LFQRRNGVLHCEDLLDFLVVDDERHNVLTSLAVAENLSLQEPPVCNGSNMKSPSAALT